jgi:hypothetical protein
MATMNVVNQRKFEGALRTLREPVAPALPEIVITHRRHCITLYQGSTFYFPREMHASALVFVRMKLEPC